MSKVELIAAAEPIRVWCPVLKARMSLTSDDLEELGPFSRFVLWAVGSGGDPARVEEVTALDSRVISEEFEFLIKIGLLQEDSVSGAVTLAERGSRLYRLLTAVDQFNEREVTVQINAVTGEVMANDGDVRRERPQAQSKSQEPDLPVLEERIIRELYQNEDPANAREFRLAHFPLPMQEQEPFREDELDGMHTHLQYEPSLAWRLMEIPCIPAWPHEEVFARTGTELPREPVEAEEWDESHALFFQLVLHPATFSLTASELDKYRHALPSMEKLQALDPELLGEKALHLLNLSRQEKAYRQRLTAVYFDPQSGDWHRTPPHAPAATKWQGRREPREVLHAPPAIPPESLTREQMKQVAEQLLGEPLDARWDIAWQWGTAVREYGSAPSHRLLQEQSRPTQEREEVL